MNLDPWMIITCWVYNILSQLAEVILLYLERMKHSLPRSIVLLQSPHSRDI